MRPEYRTRALDVAHAHLVWLTAQPSPLDAALDVLADVDSRTTIATGSRDGTGLAPSEDRRNPRTVHLNGAQS